MDYLVASMIFLVGIGFLSIAFWQIKKGEAYVYPTRLGLIIYHKDVDPLSFWFFTGIHIVLGCTFLFIVIYALLSLS